MFGYVRPSNDRLTEEERLAFYRSLTIISDSLDNLARTSIGTLSAAERNV